VEHQFLYFLENVRNPIALLYFLDPFSFKGSKGSYGSRDEFLLLKRVEPSAILNTLRPVLRVLKSLHNPSESFERKGSNGSYGSTKNILV